jgi:hypothetical protein
MSRRFGEPGICIFRVEEQAKHDICMKQVASSEFSLDIFFEPGNGSDMQLCKT